MTISNSNHRKVHKYLFVLEIIHLKGDAEIFNKIRKSTTINGFRTFYSKCINEFDRRNKQNTFDRILGIESDN